MPINNVAYSECYWNKCINLLFIYNIMVCHDDDNNNDSLAYCIHCYIWSLKMIIKDHIWCFFVQYNKF